MDVPGDFVEHSDERVNGDEAYSGFDQTPGQETTLAEARHAVALTDFLRLFGQIKCLTRLCAGHEPVSIGEIAIHQFGALTGFKILDRIVDDLAQLTPPLES